jgi:hypothetical protein
MKRAIPLPCCAALLVLLSGCAAHETVKSGYVGTATMNEDQVTQLLNQQGYTEVTNLHENGQDWIGSANKGGQVVNFDIDKRGNIHTK